MSKECLTFTQRNAYTATVKRIRTEVIPTSDITAQTVVADGFTLSQTDHAGITVTASRSYTATGMTMPQTDGRSNATTTVMDKAGRPVSVTDAAGNTASTAYDANHDQPSVVTDAQGHTACYRYDNRGRKAAEWGTGIQPATFAYDDADRLISLTTFRANTGDINTDPGNREDGDTTTWTYHDATGLETRKTYADNTHIDKSYDAFNRLHVETLARGITKTHSYEPGRGLLLGTAYSDGTTARSYQYNHLGQLTQVTDDAGTRSIGYNSYGEQETDSLLANGVTHLITETRDSYGRSTGYTYAKDGVVQQTVTTGYGTDGRIATAGFLHGGVEKQFGYSYLTGSDLLQSLTMPNNMTLTQSYEANRDLLTGMYYKRGATGVVEREYSYDTLGRPTALNQYTAIDDFVPTYDADGNQTLVKTATGIWSVQYNAENRPITFTNNESNTVVECTYDYMGRRATKKVESNGETTLHQRYLYRGYLQITACDQTRTGHPSLWLILWDPTQPIATRPLSLQKDGTWYCYGWDLTKNICEVYGQNGYVRTAYTYTPYGSASSTGDVTQPLQWSSEYADPELGLIYYNYRHYNPLLGCWLGRDLISEKAIYNRYSFTYNKSIYLWDYLGQDSFYVPPGVENAARYEYNKALNGEYEPDNVTLSEDSLNWIKENCNLFGKFAQCFDLNEVEINAVAMAIAEEYTRRSSPVHWTSDNIQDALSTYFPDHVFCLGELWRPDLGAGNVNIKTAKRLYTQLVRGKLLPEKYGQITEMIVQNGFYAQPGDLVTPQGNVFFAAAEMARLKEIVNQNGYFNNVPSDYDKAQNYVDLWRKGDSRLEKMKKNQQEKKRQNLPYIPEHKYGNSDIARGNYKSISEILKSCTKK